MQQAAIDRPKKKKYILQYLIFTKKSASSPDEKSELMVVSFKLHGAEE